MLEDGWTQGTMENWQGEVCLSQALAKATTHASDYTKTIGVLQMMVDSPVTHWNDEPGRTLGQVLDLLDEAIALTQELVNA